MVTSTRSRPLIAPDALEIAAGQMVGRDPDAPVLPIVARGGSRKAIEDELRGALARPPCIVSFSGGRDSSALLALAVFVARREGLADPIPVTLDFVGVPDASERTWQELLIGELAVDHWQRLSVGDDLDIVGPVATRVFNRHGLVFPANAYAHVPMLELAAGGSLVCGAGGDEVLGSNAVHLVQVICGRAVPRPVDARTVAIRLAPSYSRRLGTDALEGTHWLRPAARAAAIEREGRAQAQLSLRWNTAIRRWAASRYRLACLSTLRTLGDDADTRVVAPFLESSVLSALAVDGGVAGFRSRGDALEMLAGDVLPSVILRRPSKAVFTRALRGRHSAELVANWRDDEVDGELVDVALLREELQRPVPDGRTSLLVQSIAKARAGHSGSEAIT